ncbi:MAG: TetR/AcrR family transcriptional regulator [Alphaproteobacteria bacterium]|nr:TetR/AcrR family transcriptional regulator [Alphaproteobacteria bacterium]
MMYQNDNSKRRQAPAHARRSPRRTAGGAATHERIVGAAERLFAERGFSGVSMSAIAAAAGITAGAIYKHFQGKEELFFAVVRRAVEAAGASYEAEGRNGPAALASIVAVYTTPRLQRVRQLAVEIHYAAAQNAKVRRLLRSAVDRQVGDMAQWIAGAQRAGEIDAALDPQLAASSIMTLIMGLMHAETLTPQLVGEAAWRDCIATSVERLLAPR